ncbi:phage major capsid protein [Inquilinus sp. CA228]|uniref:phage major capsid protein n=1 Tax=Inquilinus sp. CA228 TaxID=3455609 RepID=UPI003F8D6AD5
MPQFQGPFLEAVELGDAGAKKFLIRVIRAGASGNGNFYPDAALREALPMFNGARVFSKSDEEHLAGKGKDFRNLVGRLAEAKFVAGQGGQDTGEIQAVLELLQPTGPIATKLREAWDRGMAELFGFSIDAVARTRTRNTAKGPLREAKSFTRVNSVDLIVEPGAGGEVINLIEAKADEAGGTTMLRDMIIRQVEALRPDLLKGKDQAFREALADEELETMLAEAVKPAEVTPAAKGGKASSGKDGQAAGDDDDVGTRVTEAIGQVTKRIERKAEIREAVNASALPAKAKGRLVEALQKRVDAGEDVTDAVVREAVKAEGDYLTEAGGGQVRVPFASIPPGGSQAEKTDLMLEAFFDREHKDHRHAQSFKAIYVHITGDERVTGQLRNCDQGRLRESLMREALDSASFADVLGNSMTRQMVKLYNLKAQLDAWRRIADVVPVNDFRVQERTRIGGYGDLPKVAEKGTYQPLTSPTDEKAEYAVEKRGGTESVTLEMIKNDDVGVIRRIPTNLSRAAKRTLSKFVFDFIRTNPVIYDGVALFHASHNNLGAAALSPTSLAAGRLAMLKQPEKDSLEPLEIGPATLMVPSTLEETAVDLFRRNTENDKTFVQSLTLDIIPVWYWVDANDWAMASDVADIAGIEIGFLDGKEEPELFVQDNPTVGSMFSNDQLTWKIRHIYGGNVLDFRAFYKAVVA